MSPSWLDLVQAETGSVTSIAKRLQVGGPMIERFRYYSNPINVDEDIAPMPADKGALGPAGLIAATVKRQPVGVVACITPYNMPLVNVAGKVAPVLVAGNTVVIKPAPQDPLGVLLLGEAVAEAGFDDGVVNIVTGSGPEAPAALVASTDVNMVSFALANDSAYGLFSYVYAGDARRAYEVGSRLESGNVALNTVQPHMHAPFGGFKMSGIGRDRGKWGIEAYTEIQAINWLS